MTALAAETGGAIAVNWERTIAKSRTSISIQVCPEPPMRRGAPLHGHIWGALRDMKIDYARLQPWYPYPRLGVAELEPPKDGRTFWDFSHMDPIVEDFYAAAEGRPVMLAFSTLPQWMLRTKEPVRYPADPNEIAFTYRGGNELRDPSMKEVVDYFHRLAGWYGKGGFHDEFGKWHASTHRFKIDYWEVLNEIDMEHGWTPKQYTALYDAVVEDLRKLDPKMKFSGLALALPSQSPEYFHYFLDPKNHKPGIPVDMFSYHFYCTPEADESPDVQQHTFFATADRFLATVRYIEAIRQRLSPGAKTYINELGSSTANPNDKNPNIPPSYWTLSGSLFAYLYPQLARLGIDAIAAAELFDYPGQYASATLVDWVTGKPNARYWVLKLLRDHFGPGDAIVQTTHPKEVILAQGFVRPDGTRKILVVNKRNREVTVGLPNAAGSRVHFVDQTTGSNPPGSAGLSGAALTLRAQAVAVVTLPR